MKEVDKSALLKLNHLLPEDKNNQVSPAVEWAKICSVTVNTSEKDTGPEYFFEIKTVFKELLKFFKEEY